MGSVGMNFSLNRNRCHDDDNEDDNDDGGDGDIDNDHGRLHIYDKHGNRILIRHTVGIAGALLILIMGLIGWLCPPLPLSNCFYYRLFDVPYCNYIYHVVSMLVGIGGAMHVYTLVFKERNKFSNWKQSLMVIPMQLPSRNIERRPVTSLLKPIIPLLKKSKLYSSLILVLFVAIAMVMFFTLQYRDIENVSSTRCHTPKGEAKRLILLASTISRVLQELSVTHFLDYSSLIGSLRYKGPVPWEDTVIFGAISEDVRNVGYVTIIQFLEREGLSAYFELWNGLFRVDYEGAPSYIYIWSDFWGNGGMKRQGIEAWIFFLNFRKYHNFPAYFIDTTLSPLPTADFGDYRIPVPHHGYGIIKYKYPDNWWTDMRPEGCEKETYLAWDGYPPHFM